MNFELRLKGVVEDYLNKTRRGSISEEEMIAIHQPLMLLSYHFRSGYMDSYSIPFPGGKKAYNEHPLNKAPILDVLDDGTISVAYNQPKVDTLRLSFSPGICPRMQDGKLWKQVGHGCYPDVVDNTSDFGYMYGSTGEGKGHFWKIEKKGMASDFTFKLWSLRIDDYITGIKFPVSILGNGDLTAFFQHVDYDGLERLFS
ncbi:MAG: hypothetical protein WCV90_06775 [Candidatus Woesearchaeota archaeon]